MPDEIIYLDNAATTRTDPRVIEAMLPYFSDQYGNASSLHQLGLDNRVAVDRTQAKIADFLGCDKNEVYFTSGATESNNMAIFGVLRAFGQGDIDDKFHIITTQIEHDAILEPCRELEYSGQAEVTYLPVDKNGFINTKDLEQSIKHNTILVSVMYANNEIGAIQPIAEVGEILKEINSQRKQKIMFHTDATQALAYCNCQVQDLGIDLMSFSAHKIYGPKGIGAIFIKKGTPIKPLIFGGHQQNNLRPGTYNVPGIVGFGRAIEILDQEKDDDIKHLTKIRDYIIKQVKSKISGVSVNGSLNSRLANNISFIIRGVEGESLVLLLSDKSLAVSTGSACSSGSLEPSHVLLAIGVPPELAHGSLRVSLGRFNKKSDADKFINELPSIVEKLRKISPLK